MVHAQGEVAEFKQWGFDIIPHRALMKQGFETPDGKRVDVETAYKDPKHPFRVAVVCAMWLTGFDVEWLSTLYIELFRGTSALVHPAASLPLRAVERGATLVEVNPQPTPLTRFADFALAGAAGVVLPALLVRLKA